MPSLSLHLTHTIFSCFTDRRYIILKQLITVNYFGKMLMFKVLSVEAEKSELLNETESMNNSNTSLLEDGITNLSLTDSNNCSYNHVADNQSNSQTIMSTPKQTERINSKRALLQTPIARHPSTNLHVSVDNDSPLVYQIYKTTKVRIIDEADEQSGECEKNLNTDRYSCIGGLDVQINILRETVELPMLRPELFRKTGL